MIQNVLVEVPEVLQCVYLMPTSRPPVDVQRRAVAAAAAWGEPLAGLVDTLVSEELVQIQVCASSELPLPPEELLVAFGATDSRLALLRSASHLVAVTGTGTPDWPPAYDWSARFVAAHLGARLDVPVLDVLVPRLVPADILLSCLPTAGRGIALAQWVLVPQSLGPSGCYAVTKGLSRFGLPELAIVDVPPPLARPWTGVLSGIASVLLSAWRSALDMAGTEPPAFVELPGEVELNEADVATAHAATPTGGGSARIGLRLEPAASPLQDTHLMVGPPEADPAAAGEFATRVCRQLFGAALGRDVGYLGHAHGMERAIAVARQGLPQARDRFTGGSLAPGRQLMVKYRADAGQDREYLWVLVTSWSDPDYLTATSAGRDSHAAGPIRIPLDAVIDWAIATDTGDFIEGGHTNAVLTGG